MRTQELKLDFTGEGLIADRIDGVIKRLGKQLPPMVNKEYIRKRYSVPSSHYDPATYSVMELLTALGDGRQRTFSDGVRDFTIGAESKPTGVDGNITLRGESGEVDVSVDKGFNAGVIDSSHRELARLNYPTYFIAQQTLQMLDNSNMSDGIEVDSIIFPLPSMLISLPRDTWVNGLGEEKELVALSITRTFEYRDQWTGECSFNENINDELATLDQPWRDVQEDLQKGDALPWEYNPAKGQIIPNLLIVGVYANGAASVAKYPIADDSISSLIEKHKGMYHADELLAAEYLKQSSEGKDMKKRVGQEIEQMSEVVVLAIKILCFMSLKKDEWSHAERVVKPARYKKGKLKEEEKWGANFIGRAYGEGLRSQGYGNTEDRDGRKQRYHWRQGHFRGVRYGKGRAKYKTVFVEPYCVNPPDEKTKP